MKKAVMIGATLLATIGAHDVRAEETSYNFHQLNAMGDQQLIATLERVKWNQISDLFQFNEDTKAFYSNERKLQLIINELAKRGASYTATDSKSIETFVEVLRSGFYLGFYHQELKPIYARDVRDRCLPALKAIAKNPNFKLGTETQNEVISAFGKLIGNASVDNEVIRLATPIVEQYGAERDFSRSRGAALYDILQGIDYDLTAYRYETNKQEMETPAYGQIDRYVSAVTAIGQLGVLPEEHTWVVNNGLYYAGKLSGYLRDKTPVHRALTAALTTQPFLSEPYFVAVERLQENFGGVDANGKKIDLEEIKQQGRAKYLPKTYTFDNGTMVVRAGAHVAPEKVKRLYWAAKEVKAQFHRVIGSDKPLEVGNKDDVLTMVIYNSPDEYKMNRQLYGYSTDNGGLYIEEEGTFFTYERTLAESIYSLEELFRHEYTHYLQGRYEVPGLFGRSPIYEDERLTWFQEGNAEFFAGATRLNNVVPRSSMIGGLAPHEAERYTANRTVYSRYGSWDFYKYSFALQSYLYQYDFATFDALQDAIRANDVATYDRLRAQIGRDSQLERAYQNYMQSLIDHQSDYTVPAVSDDYLLHYAPRTATDIERDIRATLPLTNVQTTLLQSESFTTVDVRGTFVGTRSSGEQSDWKAMSGRVNEALRQLSAHSWGGYKTYTAYFVNYRVKASGQYEYDVVFHGLGSAAQRQPLSLQVNGTAALQLGEEAKWQAVTNREATVEWSFGDGTTARGTDVTHSFTRAGQYTVTVRAVDADGEKVEEKLTVTVTEVPSDDGFTLEQEPNNAVDEAQVVSYNRYFRGALAGDDHTDVYRLNVKEATELGVYLANESKSGLTWVMHRADDMQSFYSYGIADGDWIANDVTVTPGVYYIYVYKYDALDGHYSLYVRR